MKRATGLVILALGLVSTAHRHRTATGPPAADLVSTWTLTSSSRASAADSPPASPTREDC